MLVGLELLLLPALRRLAGAADPGPSTFRLPLTSALRRDPQRLRVRPVRIVAGGAEPLGADLSHQLGRAALADALALVPVGDGELAAGAPVDLIDLWRCSSLRRGRGRRGRRDAHGRLVPASLTLSSRAKTT